MPRTGHGQEGARTTVQLEESRRQRVSAAKAQTRMSNAVWTERIGPAAALKTLEVMERIKSWDTITQTGLQIRNRCQLLADQHGLAINHWGLLSLTGYTFQSGNALACKSLLCFTWF